LYGIYSKLDSSHRRIGGAATAAQLSAPNGVFGEAAGYLFIAEEEGHRFLGGQMKVYELAEITPGGAHEEQNLNRMALFGMPDSHKVA